MSEVEKYQDLSRKVHAAECWLDLLMRAYRGGGGGIRDIASMSVQAEIYHQEYEGAANCHKIPEGLDLALANVIKKHARDLISEAIKTMQNEAADLAKRAAKEYAELMRAAGLEN